MFYFGRAEIKVEESKSFSRNDWRKKAFSFFYL